MRRFLTIAAAVSVLAVAGSTHAQSAAGVLGSWSGFAASELTFTTETFAASGAWEITLAASCFEGIGFARAVAYDEAGAEVGRVRVLGEGIESVVLDTEPGEYYLEITVSHFHIYFWELQAQAIEGELAAEGAEAGGPGLDATDVAIVEIPHAWAGDDIFTTEHFEAAGEWEIVFAAWCYDGVSLVRVIAYDQDGEEVERVTVVGQGVESVVLDTEPGMYYLEVSSPDMHDYNWELVVRPVEAAD